MPIPSFLENLTVPNTSPVQISNLEKYKDSFTQVNNLVSNGPYKLINLTNSIPITSFDYQIGLATRSDVIYPLYLEPGEVCQVKFAFIKKSLFDNNFEY